MVEKLTHFIAHSDRVNCISASRSQRDLYLSGGDDGTVKLWHIRRPSCVGGAKLSATAGVESVQFNSRDTTFAAGISSGGIQLFSLKSWTKLAKFSGHRSAVRTLAFHTWGNYLISGSDDTNVKLWSVKEKACLKTFRAHSTGVVCVDYCPDGRWFASGSEDGKVILWDARMCKQLKELHAHDGPVVSLQFHPEKQYLASASEDRTGRVWSLNGNCDQIFSTDKDKTKIKKVCFAGTNNLNHLVMVSEDNIKVWNWEDDYFVEQFDCSSVGKLVQDVAFLKEEQQCRLYTSRGSTISLWQQTIFQPNESVTSAKPGATQSTYESPAVPKGPSSLTRLHIESADELETRTLALTAKAKSDQRIEAESIVEIRSKIRQEEKSSSPSHATDPSPVADHGEFMKVLKLRLQHAKEASELPLQESAEFLLQKKDLSLVAQSLRNSDVERRLADIEGCAQLLPLLSFLFTSTVEDQLVVALNMTKFFLKSFAMTIKSTLEWSKKNDNAITTVDIARDNRIHKCNKCWEGFKQIQAAITPLLSDGSPRESKEEAWSNATKRDIKYVHDRLDKFLND